MENDDKFWENYECEGQIELLDYLKELEENKDDGNKDREHT